MYDDVRAKETALKRSLGEIRKASEQTWSDAQTRLAADYEAYAAAVARAEAAANANASATGSSSMR